MDWSGYACFVGRDRRKKGNTLGGWCEGWVWFIASSTEEDNTWIWRGIYRGGGNEFRDEGMEKGEGNREGTWICKELVGGLGREKGLSMLVWGLLELDL